MEFFFKLETIDAAAQWFWNHTSGRHIFAFHGPLGAGKTTFIAALCRAKGVLDTPSSPTFSLINDYMLAGSNGQQHAYHLDLYRIRDEEEAVQAGIEDCLLSGSLCFVEWPEKIPGLLPEDALHITISTEKEGRRLCLKEKNNGK